MFYLAKNKHDKGLIEILQDVKAVSSNNFINNAYKF